MKEGIIIIAVLVALLVWEKVQRIVEGRRWAGERRDLLNRVMARNFDEYVVSTEQPVVRIQQPVGSGQGEDQEPEEDIDLARGEHEVIAQLTSKAEAGYQEFVGRR